MYMRYTLRFCHQGQKAFPLWKNTGQKIKSGAQKKKKKLAKWTQDSLGSKISTCRVKSEAASEIAQVFLCKVQTIPL